jgi:hypothetical protein
VIYFKNRKISFSAKMLLFSGINPGVKWTRHKKAGAMRSISKKKILFSCEKVFISGNKYRLETVASQKDITSGQYCAPFPVIAFRCAAHRCRCGDSANNPRSKG